MELTQVLPHTVDDKPTLNYMELLYSAIKPYNGAGIPQTISCEQFFKILYIQHYKDEHPYLD